MRKLGMISFSLTGAVLSEKLEIFWKKQGWQVENVSKSAYLPDSWPGSLKEWARRRFEDCEAVVFIGACGIAVRGIAPYVKSKKTDPAVLVIDECGMFVISLLSGHLGGANALAREAADFLGAQAVVTTATDLHDRFAVDVFAKRNGVRDLSHDGGEGIFSRLAGRGAGGILQRFSLGRRAAGRAGFGEQSGSEEQPGHWSGGDGAKGL